jgi:epsilon-lactone hydrolase
MKVPTREIPVPTSVSSEAQAVLAAGLADRPDWPPPDDTQGWLTLRGLSEEANAVRQSSQQTTVARDDSCDVDGVTVYAVSPIDAIDGDPRIYLNFHPGALVMGGGESCREFCRSTALDLGMNVWGVDYRMPPEHPYPAALDDGVSVYRALLREHLPEHVVVGGVSAGGNLAAATILRARDEGLPLPAAAILVTPQIDLTESGDTFQTNMGVDTVLTKSLMPVNLLYAAGHDLCDPYLSPLFGDFKAGFPPTFLSAGTRDVFLSNAVRMHRRLRAAGITTDLNVFEAMPHGGFLANTPEDDDLQNEINQFVQRHCGYIRRDDER